ncbi:MAG: hypothetical protein ACFB8W_05255 [Elainellaceae cyanobacterium]
MSQKIAIAVVHGIGKADPEFAEQGHPKFLSGIVPRIQKEFAAELKMDISSARQELEFVPVYWAEVMQARQDKLYGHLNIESRVSRFLGLRDFIFHSLADSIAYQPTPPDDGPNLYGEVHRVFAKAIHELADKAGENAPLCMIGHSMGAAIASNYIWDTQQGRIPANAHDNPLERGETLASLYTFGSQLPFWAMRFPDFGKPPQVPSPKLWSHYPEAQGEWLNFYDRNDLLGYPVKDINSHYRAVVSETEVSVGNLLTGWNTFAHDAYWHSDQVIRPIAQSLARLWKQVNPTPLP